MARRVAKGMTVEEFDACPEQSRRASSAAPSPVAAIAESADEDSATPFTPAQLRPRHDGWTALKQIAFIEALAESGCVEEACRRVGMSDTSAYKLRRRPCGAAFRKAWDAALDYSLSRLEQAALGRALNGVARPIFHRSEQVGEWREYDERLTMFLLRARRPERFGKWIERMLAPEFDEETNHPDPAIRLDGGLESIEWAGDRDTGDDEDENEDGDHE